MKKQTWIKLGVMIAIIVAILIVDLTTKYVFDVTLSDGKMVVVIPHLFNFKLVHNMGAAWGMLAGKQLFLIVLSLVFLAIFIYYYVKEKNKTWLLTVAFGFLFAGCIGNLYDRIFIGYVRDFIQFDFWQSFPIFNFADVFLCIGVVLFIVYLILYFVKTSKARGVKVEDFREKDEKRKGEKLESHEKQEEHFSFDDADFLKQNGGNLCEKGGSTNQNSSVNNRKNDKKDNQSKNIRKQNSLDKLNEDADD